MKYSLSHDPPAPIAKVKIKNKKTSETAENIEMLLDTGADITIVPKKFCESIDIEISEDSVELEGFNTAKSIAFYANFDFYFLNKMFRGNFLVLDLEEGIIGRDILNEFTLEFDGQILEWKQI